jgi:hypothetical protein
LEAVVRTLIAPFILLASLGIATLDLGGPASAGDVHLRKSSAEEMKSVCDKVGGNYSQDAHGYGCGTDCNGKPGTDCVVYCKTDDKCTAQVIGARRPTSLQSALQAPARHAR